MKYLKLIAAIALFASFSIIAHAQDNAAQPQPQTSAPAGADDMFKTFQATQDYLASQGIHPSSIDWQQIDLLCAGLKSSGGDVSYNSCSYSKAVDLTLHENDKAQCTTQATGAYPDTLTATQTDTLTEADRNGVSHSFKRDIPGISNQSLQQERAGGVVECMQKMGWVNADDWRLGKRSDYCK